jgi:hypothetical protein
VILAVVDVLRLSFALASLAVTPHICLWFFVILADAQIIFLIQKGDQARSKELRLSKYKIIGLLLFGVSNSYMTVLWQSVTVQIAFCYLALSVAEYFILLSAVSPSPLVEQICEKF